MLLIDCQINLILTWLANCFIIASAIGGQVPTFAITDNKLYVSVVTLWTQNNVKLLDQLKSHFKRNINWNKYQSNAKIQARKQYLDCLINPSFQGINRHFLLLLKMHSKRVASDISFKL